MIEKYFLIDLQLFSEEKTEEPTAKKREDSRKKGQVLQSRDVSAAVVLLSTMMALKLSSGYILESTSDTFEFATDLFYSNIFDTTLGGYQILIYIIFFVAKTVIIAISAGFISGFLVSRLQVGNLFTTETLKFKPERLNPVEGLKKMFSMRSLMEMVKSLLKISVVGFVGYSYIADNIGLILKSMELNNIQYSFMLYDMAMDLAMRMIFAIFIIAILDYFYQKYDYEKNLKMSKQEIKEEYKMSEGDPQVKSKIKERQRQAAMRRMMQDVPKADVIITNPTHFAVAIKYDENRFDAPYVVAKGKNLVALKIKERAQLSGIVMVENRPLAQALYNDLEIGMVISQEFYEAVADVLAYVYSLKKNG